jgi:predicted esterase
MSTIQSPHAATPTATAGTPLVEAERALVLVHGRGASAESILGLAQDIRRLAGPLPENLALLAPQAAGHTWYPYSFLAPEAQNEPYLTSALDRLASVVDNVQAAGIAPEQTAIVGFSQGACLALEFAARSGKRFGAVAALSGGLIGEALDTSRYRDGIAGTPVFLGCSDRDAHIPLTRVKESTELLNGLGAEVDERIYPGMPHTVIPDELQAVQKLLAGL